MGSLGASFAKMTRPYCQNGKRHPDVQSMSPYPNSTILGGDTVVGANYNRRQCFYYAQRPCKFFGGLRRNQLIMRNKADRRKSNQFDWDI
jgi:hypothetical protein